MKRLIPCIVLFLFLSGCSMKEKDTVITVFENNISCVYTGKGKNNIPHGEGLASMEEGTTAEGLFENGILVSGKTVNVSYTTSFSKRSLIGLYTGEVSNQLPSGNGLFTSESFTYDGTWINGLPSGTGTVSSEWFSITTPSGSLEGTYSGEVAGGLAEGSGVFTYYDGSEQIEMSGSFSDNTFDGILTRTVYYPSAVKAYPVIYENGIRQESAPAMIAYMEGMRNVSYCLSQQQLSFLIDHCSLFEGTASEADVSAETVHEFDDSSFDENSTPEFILINHALIMSIQRYKPYEGSDTVTSMIVRNEEGWYHLFFAYSVETADQGETVSIYALPLCRSILTAPEQDYPAVDAAGAVMVKEGF